MLNESVGGADTVFLVGALLVQATLVVLLLLSLRSPDAVAGEKT